jgi:lipoprotein-anchoring transpeptidase ErfK/SrfK
LHPVALLGALFVISLIVIIVSVAAGVGMYYNGRILPGVKVAGVKLGSLPKEKALTQLENATKNYQVIFQVGDKTFTPKPAELGITIDTKATIDAVYGVGHSGGLADRLGDWGSLGNPDHPVIYKFDEKVLDNYVNGLVQTTSTPAVNAKLVISGAAVAVQPETWGQATGIESAALKVKQSLHTFSTVKFQLGLKKLEPAIKATDLTSAKSQAEGMISTPVSLTYGGVVYAPNAATKATWLVFTEDVNARTEHVSVSSAAIKGYLSSVVTPRIAYAATPRIVTVNADQNNAESVAQEGKDGLTVDADAVARQVSAALLTQKAFSMDVPTQAVAFATQTHKVYDRWIDVSLGTQTLTAYQQGQVVRSFLISSGTAYHPTVQGTFYIYGKTRSQTMSGGSRAAGDYYSLPNVEWISWWYGDYSIHGTYWHHNFGHPMSHGCLNATNEDAQFIYEWAPIGTPVVIHE